MKPDTLALSALKKYFGKELRIIEVGENKINMDNGAEYLHKLRISVRKTRTLLGYAKYVLPERTILKYNREFKFLAQKTSKSRDLDVYLNTLNEFKLLMQDNPDEAHNDLYKYINENKIKEEKKLLVYLNSGKYTRLKKDWAKILDKPASKYSRLKYANTPIEYVLKRGIIKQYKKMFKQGNEIDINAPYQKYHELRKTCKKLRYSLEYFNDLHSKKKIKSLVKAIKNFQDILGELQDHRIQIESLNNFIKIKSQDNQLSEEFVNKIELLIKKLDDRCRDIKSVYPEIFDELSSKLTKKSYKKLFNHNKNAIDYKYQTIEI